MAKGRPNKEWLEGELIRTFNLNRIVTYQTPLMQKWLKVQMPELNSSEQYVFDKIFKRAQRQITGWQEEDVKMKFISPILELGQMIDDEIAIGYFDQPISAKVDAIKLSLQSDFMLATGILDYIKTPYFHFQQYKPVKNPIGDSMGQLLASFLITQENNKNGLPLYGVEIMRSSWHFVILQGRDYCISKAFDSVKRTDLLIIIAILRKFKSILETRLMIV
jgi:hypothetical protein